MRAARIAEWSKALGGDGSLALYYSDAAHNRRQPWEAITTIDRPRQRGRYRSARGADPEDAMRNLLRVLPPLPN